MERIERKHISKRFLIIAGHELPDEIVGHELPDEVVVDELTVDERWVKLKYILKDGTPSVWIENNPDTNKEYMRYFEIIGLPQEKNNILISKFEHYGGNVYYLKSGRPNHVLLVREEPPEYGYHCSVEYKEIAGDE